jgi:HEAT repeat protein
LPACLLLAVLVVGCGESKTNKKPPKSKPARAEKPKSNSPPRVHYREPRYTDKRPEEWIARFDHKNPHLQEQAVSMLVQYGPKHVPKMIELVQSEKSGAQRMRAMRALGQFGPRAEEAVPVLIEALSDRQCQDRDVAAESLGKIGRRPQQTVPALVQALRDPDDRVRTTASRALSRFGEEAAEAGAVPPLTAMLKDDDMNVRAYAADALGAIGPPARSAVAALKQANQAAQRSGHFAVRQATEAALGKIGGG